MPSAPKFRSAGPMTLNNYTPAELDHLRIVTTFDDTKIKYVTFNRGMMIGTYGMQIDGAQMFEPV